MEGCLPSKPGLDTPSPGQGLLLCPSPGGFSAAIPLPSIQYRWSVSVRYSICTEWLLHSCGGEMGFSPSAEQHPKPEPSARGTGRDPWSQGCPVEELHAPPGPREPHGPRQWAPACLPLLPAHLLLGQLLVSRC